MMKRLIMLVGLFLIIISGLASAESTNNESSTSLPPLVIEEKDLRYVGITLDWSKHPSIRARQTVNIHQDTSPVSPVVGEISADKRVPILDAVAYIYPRMGALKIIDTYSVELGSLSLPENAQKNLPKINDTAYLIYYENKYHSNDAGVTIVWYKNKYLFLAPNGLDMPKIYYDDPSRKNFKNDKLYAKYEGYTNPLDSSDDFVPYGEYSFPDDDIGEGNGWRQAFFGYRYRRNADVWLYVQTKDGTKGWIQFSNAHLGANENIWWHQQFLGDAHAFDNDFGFTVSEMISIMAK